MMDLFMDGVESLKGKRNEKQFYEALEEIKALLDQANEGEIACITSMNPVSHWNPAFPMPGNLKMKRLKSPAVIASDSMCWVL